MCIQLIIRKLTSKWIIIYFYSPTDISLSAGAKEMENICFLDENLRNVETPVIEFSASIIR